MGRETLEPHELMESEDFDAERPRPLSVRVALTAAILAVLASISSLEAEHTAAEAILHKNDAVLWQAKSIKLHLQELRPGEASPAAADRSEIVASEERARADERERDEANAAAMARFEQHHRFAIGTSLLQIAIVLETVAAVVGRRWLWYGGMLVGAAGALALANGFLGLA